MTKRHLNILERAFAAEIEGRRYQTQAKAAQELVEMGMLVPRAETSLTPLGPMTCEWLDLTHLGRMTYCESCERIPASARLSFAAIRRGKK